MNIGKTRIFAGILGGEDAPYGHLGHWDPGIQIVAVGKYEEAKAFFAEWDRTKKARALSDTYDYEKSKLEKVKNNEGLDLLFLKYAKDCKNLVDEELKKNFNFNFNFFYKSKAEWYVYLLNLKMRKIYLKKLLILKKKYQDVISYVKNFSIEEETVIWIVLFLSELLKKYESQNQ